MNRYLVNCADGDNERLYHESRGAERDVDYLQPQRGVVLWQVDASSHQHQAAQA